MDFATQYLEVERDKVSGGDEGRLPTRVDPSDPRVTPSQDCHVRTTSRFNSSIWLSTKYIDHRCKDFIVCTLAYNSFECRISVPQVRRYTSVGKFLYNRAF